MNKFLIVTVLCVAGPLTANAQNSWMDKVKALKDQGTSAVTKSSLGDTKIGEGLKEALKVGIKNAIAKTGRTDGFYKNEAIKINLPDNLKMFDKGLRAVGMGQSMDEFVLSMNRAAEKAAPMATDTFMDAIFAMSIEDAQKLLNGSDTAATQYFKDKTYQSLKDKLRPMVQKSLGQYDVTKRYGELTAKLNTLPFSKAPVFNPEEYVLDKGLDGLFKVLAEEEIKIRKDPSARVTTLLQQVFQ